MAKSPPAGESFRNRALFDRSNDPLFVLNRRRRLRYANSAFEHLVRDTLENLYNLHCIRDRRASPLAQALGPPPEVMSGTMTRIRRPAAPAKAGPPWWDISFFPLMGPDGLLGIVGRISVVGVRPADKPRAFPEALFQLRSRLRTRFDFASIAGDTPIANRIADQARLASQSTAPLALIGEPGTGKNWLARTIHYQGVTSERNFLTVDCDALPLTALAPLLFGDLGLASPGKLGTLYIRHAASLPRDLQAQLVDAMARAADSPPRIIGGFCRDPQIDIQENRLLSDLFHRLSVQTIGTLPLRERIGELPRFADEFLHRCAQCGIRVEPNLSQAAVEVLQKHAWPGNLRELEQVVTDAARQANGVLIEPSHLPRYIREGNASPLAETPRDRRTPLLPLMEQFERRLILLALRQTRGNKGEAAKTLELSRTELWRRMNNLSIGDDDWRTLTPRSG